MMTADLFDYDDNKERFRLPKKIKGFAEAIWEVEEDPDLVITLGKPPSKRRKRSSITNNRRNKESSPVRELEVSSHFILAFCLGLFAGYDCCQHCATEPIS